MKSENNLLIFLLAGIFLFTQGAYPQEKGTKSKSVPNDQQEVIEEEVEEVKEEEKVEVEEEVESESAIKKPPLTIEKVPPPKNIIEPLPVKPKPKVEEFPPPGVVLAQNDWITLKFIGVFAQYFRLTTEGIGDDYENTVSGSDNYNNEVDFVTKRIRTILTGNFWKERVSFLLQGDLTETALFNDGEQDSGFLLDARVDIKPFIGIGPKELSGISISFGRYIPDFTYYMPRNVGLLDFVEYPLVTSSFAPWRQIGIEVSFNHKYFEILGGVFNGMRFRRKPSDDPASKDSDMWIAPGYLAATLGKNSNLSDDNNAKDFLVKIKGKYPDYGLWLEVFSYISMPEFYQGDSHSNGRAITFGGEAGIEHRVTSNLRIKIIGGYSGRWIEFPKNAFCNNTECEAYTQMGFFIHAGALIGRWVEPLVRIDWFNDRGEFLAINKVPGLSEGEEVWTLWPSVGLKFPLYGDHVQVTLVDTFKHYANPHMDDSNDFTIQLILLL